MDAHKKSGSLGHQAYYPTGSAEMRHSYQLVDETYRAMYKKADETIEYVNSMLETSEYYL
jgi:hypothetical protein